MCMLNDKSLIELTKAQAYKILTEDRKFSATKAFILCEKMQVDGTFERSLKNQMELMASGQ